MQDLTTAESVETLASSADTLKAILAAILRPAPTDSWLEDAQAALAIVQRRRELWALPIANDEDIPFMLGLADSTYHATKSSEFPPPIFSVGRRVFAKTEDLLRWVDERAKGGSTPILKAVEREVAQAIKAAEKRKRRPPA